jgi:non-specific protein-tyrosine kinase
LADYLLDDRPIHELIVWPGVDSLTLISGGRTIRDSAELIASPKMKTLVAEMKTRYDDRYVFFDVPPLLESADAFTFAPFVDSILMVVEADRTPINDVKKALELLPQEKFLGFVLNRHKAAAKSYDNGRSRTTIPRFWKRSTEAPAVDNPSLGKRLLQGMTMSESESDGDNTPYL